jgi:ABC-type bacteriocin/lantibiotic exporter with double-glycine peptidase domain
VSRSVAYRREREVEHPVAPQRLIPTDVNASEVLGSPDLIGCYGLKPVTQTRDYTCGAAAAATVLRWFDLHANEYLCAEAMGTNQVVGTRWVDLVKYLTKRGLKVTAYINFTVTGLKERCAQQLPTLVEWLDWGGHWVTHVGYEPNLKALVFADPARPRSRFCCHTEQTFERYWVAGGTGSMKAQPAVAITVDQYHGGAIREKTRVSNPSLIDWVTRKEVLRAT